MENVKKLTLIFALAFFGFIGLFSLAVITSYVSAHDYGAKTEQELEATYLNNQNLLSSYQQKVLETAQVPTMMAEDLNKLVKSAIEGRYGEKGSQAIVQMIQEQNPNLNPDVYLNIQQLIKSGSNEFKNGQTRLLDQKAAYKTQLNSFWYGKLLSIAGFPKADLDKFNIVVTEQTRESFNSGTLTPLNLRPKQ